MGESARVGQGPAALDFKAVSSALSLGDGASGIADFAWGRWSAIPSSPINGLAA
ncbi:hypothetical protein ACWIG5_33145 [Streptomyces lydicus]